jgi:phosphotransferase system enzyme I (PtsP)
MPLSALGPRVLLRRLREVMARPEPAQKKLDAIVTLIAANMVAEVCSLYVLRSGQTLELYATEGLKREAVHKSKLRVGEGLVGTIAAEAEPLNLSDAQSHPAFKYLPETGEEIYHSFLGVPILRGGVTIGVLVVQNRTSRQYSEDEEEALQTTAMVLAEVIASGELEEVALAVDADVAHIRSHHLKGNSLAEGIALGHVVLHEPRIIITNLIAENIPLEKQRLEQAVAALQESVETLINHAESLRGAEYAGVLETFRMFAHDRGWLRRMREAIDTGLTAEGAVERVQNDNRARMLRIEDSYLRERLSDLDDLANRLLRILTGQIQTAAAAGNLPKDTILVARNMGPADLLDYDRQKLRGLVLEEAGATSHVAIVARAIGIPAVGKVDGVVEIVDTGDPIIVDGQAGDVHVRPSWSIEQAYSEKVRFYARKQAQYAALRNVPAVTKDGVAISININAGLLVDMSHLHDSGADGIGLYRTELQFMMAASFPRLAVQVNHYSTVLENANGKPIVFRTLDLGADKALPYLRQPREDNPAMGWRAIRIALERRALLELQVRALLRAAAGRELRIMFPMIAETSEFRAAKSVVEKVKASIEAKRHKLPASIKLGTMIEVPALLWQLDNLLKEVDFISIGSNDLMQFLFACDRSHARLQGRYDTLNPAVLSLIREVVTKAHQHRVPVNLCGEMAGRPIEAMALIGLGLRSISMAPAAVGPVKSMILALDEAKIRNFLEPMLTRPDPSLRPELEAFARRHDIPV